MEIFLILYAPLGILSLVWALSITSRLASIRDEARKHTALLEEIARHTRPAGEAASGKPVATRIPGIN